MFTILGFVYNRQTNLKGKSMPKLKKNKNCKLHYDWGYLT